MPDELSPGYRLDSWKTIAAYLGRDVRTVIRWEQSRGLPVRRMPGDSRSGVYAFKSEIDAWMTGQSAALISESAEAEEVTSVSPRTLRWIPAAAALLAVLILSAASYVYARKTSRQPASATFTTSALQAWDDHHQLLWEYPFGQPLARVGVVGDIDPETHQPMTYDAVDRASSYDIFGDGKKELLAVAHFARGGSLADDPRQVLYCFSPKGKLLWTYEPETVLAFGNRTYRAPWQIGDVIVSDEPGQKTIWVSVLAYTWGKSFIARLDAAGHSAIQFVNSGEISVLQRFQSPAGPMLWIGGFNDEYDTASLALMRDTQSYAVSPQTPGGHYDCIGCAEGDPLAYFVFPRYDMSRILRVPNNKVFAITSDANSVVVRQAEISHEHQILYDFSNDHMPKPTRVNYSSGFWENHLELERQGRVNHAMEICPDRLHPPPVRVYEGKRWREIVLPSRYSKH